MGSLDIRDVNAIFFVAPWAPKAPYSWSAHEWILMKYFFPPIEKSSFLNSVHLRP